LAPLACLNLVHRGIECRRCSDACPVDAISIEDAAPVLDVEACVGCRVCVAVCPTDAYGGDGATERTLCRAVAEQQPADLVVACVRRTDPRRVPIAASAIVTYSRCLGSLDPGHLLDLADHGKRRVTLDDSLCGDCAVGSVHDVIADAVDAAGAFLHDHDAIDLATTAPAPRSVPGEHGAAVVIDGAHPLVSRRRLLSSVLRPNRLKPSRDSVPRSRARLLDQLDSVGPFAARRVPIADVRVDEDACSACVACAQFCPTDALAASSEDGRFTLSFLASDCLDCGICAVACPEAAVRFGDAVDEINTRRTLVSLELAACESCATQTATRPGSDGRILCTWCRRGAGAVRPLHDEAGLFDDLNRHIDT